MLVITCCKYFSLHAVLSEEEAGLTDFRLLYSRCYSACTNINVYTVQCSKK